MTATDCQWSEQANEEGKFPCVRCGFPISDRSIRKNCRPAKPPAPGLGDWVAKALESVGIHKKPGGCTPCDQRQAKLNSLGEKVKRLLGG